MGLISFKRGQGSIVLRVKILDSTVLSGAGKTGLTHASAGLIVSTIADNEATATAYTQAAGNLETITTLGTFAAPTSGKARFKEVDATNHPGIYEIQIADARFAVSSSRFLTISIIGAAGVAETDVVIPLTAVDPYGAAFLTTGEHTAIANEVETQIIDESDSEKVLEAIVNKINDMTDLDALTLAAIATAVKDALEASGHASGLPAIKAVADTILADTNELQTDLVNGGRLDLLIDGIKAKTDLITADAFTAGTRFLTMIELDTSVYRFTVNALEQGPGTSGGGPVDVNNVQGKVLGGGSAEIVGVGVRSETPATIGGTAGTGTAIIGDALEAAAGNYWRREFTASGFDSTGWTEMVFAIKKDADTDPDEDALVLVRVTNPGDGSDGLLTLNGRAADDDDLATISVSATSPNTVVTVTLQAGALQIEPSGTQPFDYELVMWVDDKKEQIGKGDFTVTRSVVRASEAP